VPVLSNIGPPGFDMDSLRKGFAKSWVVSGCNRCLLLIADSSMKSESKQVCPFFFNTRIDFLAVEGLHDSAERAFETVVSPQAELFLPDLIFNLFF